MYDERLTPDGETIASKKDYELFPIEGNGLVKLFRAHVPIERIEREAQTSRLVHAAGLPSLRVDRAPVRRRDGRVGIVFERVPGERLSALYSRHPGRLFGLTDRIAQLHRHIHETPAVEGLPSQKMRLGEDVLSAGRLSLDARRTLYRTLEALPDGERVCHGNLHPSHVLVDGDTTIATEWGDAVNGNPLADVARTAIILRYPVAQSADYGSRAARIYCLLRSAVYVRRYFAGDRSRLPELRRWLVVCAAARLREELPPESSRRIARLIAVALPRLRGALPA
jgi:Ser/Thr protein kinase RdoA (MazF antagonist)